MPLLFHLLLVLSWLTAIVSVTGEELAARKAVRHLFDGISPNDIRYVHSESTHLDPCSSHPVRIEFPVEIEGGLESISVGVKAKDVIGLQVKLINPAGQGLLLLENFSCAFLNGHIVLGDEVVEDIFNQTLCGDAAAFDCESSHGFCDSKIPVSYEEGVDLLEEQPTEGKWILELCAESGEYIKSQVRLDEFTQLAPHTILIHPQTEVVVCDVEGNAKTIVFKTSTKEVSKIREGSIISGRQCGTFLIRVKDVEIDEDDQSMTVTGRQEWFTRAFTRIHTFGKRFPKKPGYGVRRRDNKPFKRDWNKWTQLWDQTLPFEYQRTFQQNPSWGSLTLNASVHASVQARIWIDVYIVSFPPYLENIYFWMNPSLTLEGVFTTDFKTQQVNWSYDLPDLPLPSFEFSLYMLGVPCTIQPKITVNLTGNVTPNLHLAIPWRIGYNRWFNVSWDYYQGIQFGSDGGLDTSFPAWNNIWTGCTDIDLLPQVQFQLALLFFKTAGPFISGTGYVRGLLGVSRDYHQCCGDNSLKMSLTPGLMLGGGFYIDDGFLKWFPWNVPSQSYWNLDWIEKPNFVQSCVGSAALCPSQRVSCCPQASQQCLPTQHWDNVKCACACSGVPQCQSPQVWDGSRCACVCPAIQTCPSGQAWDSSRCACACSAVTQCPSPQIWDGSRCACVCPAIQTCPSGQAWDSSRCACACSAVTQCPSPQVWDGSRCACVCPAIQTCPSGQAWDSSRCACVCSSTQQCPTQKVWNPQTCTCRCQNEYTCSSGRLWSNDTCSCFCNVTGTCPSGKYWSDDECGCVCSHRTARQVCGPGQKWDNENCTCVCLGDAEMYCRRNYGVWNNQTCSCACPQNRTCVAPFTLDPTTCQCLCSTPTTACASGQYWYPAWCLCICAPPGPLEKCQIWDGFSCYMYWGCPWFTKVTEKSTKKMLSATFELDNPGMAENIIVEITLNELAISKVPAGWTWVKEGPSTTSDLLVIPTSDISMFTVQFKYAGKNPWFEADIWQWDDVSTKKRIKNPNPQKIRVEKFKSLNSTVQAQTIQ